MKMGLIGLAIFSTLSLIQMCVPYVPDNAIQHRLGAFSHTFHTVLSFGAAQTAVNITAIIESCVGVDMKDNGVMGESMAMCPAKTGNLAKGKLTNQSSLYTVSVNGGPSGLAVDGNRNQSYSKGSCTHTRLDTRPHWWQVDLDQNVTVSAVVIYNRADQLGYHLKNFAVEVGIPDANGQVDYRNCSYHDGPAASIVNITCWPPLCGRYVRVIKQDDDDKPLTLCEVEVFGMVLEPQTSCTTSTADGTSTLTDQRVTMTTNGEPATSPSTMSSNKPSPLTTQEVTYSTTVYFATGSDSILSTKKLETLTPQKETTPYPTEVSSTPDTIDGSTNLPTQPAASSTVDKSPTCTSASSSVVSSTLPTQETNPSMNNLSAESASATSKNELTTLIQPKSGSSTADVITPGSMTSQETSTQQETDSSTADVATPDSMTSQETSTQQKTGSSKADVRTSGSVTSQETPTPQGTGSSTADVIAPSSMTSQETSTPQETGGPTTDVATSGSMTSQETGGPMTDVTTTGSMTSREKFATQESDTATHAYSPQTRNPYTTGDFHETLPAKHPKCCRCVFLVSSNTSKQTITAVEKTMTQVKQSLLVNRTQVGKSIRKKTSAGDERTSSNIGGFAAVVILTSIFVFFLVFDCLGCIRGCATYLKRSNTTSPSSQVP